MTLSRVVFAGGYDLWVTNGTAAATSELTVAGADPAGLFFPPGGFFPVQINPDFTVLGSTALFVGDDASNRLSLWVTDGTSGGTSELTVAGANSLGLFGGVPTHQFTVLGSKAVFEGADASNYLNLWVTDGTAAGTRELTVAGADPAGLFVAPSGVFPPIQINPDFTVLGSTALFDGADASGNYGLWVTDGTAAGTSELTVAGAYLSGLHAIDLTVLGSKALFDGTDAGGNYTLWVTDGTSAGTSELTVTVAGADLTVLGSQALFVASNRSLWVTDGTSAGTSELTVAGVNPSGLFQGVLDPDFTVLGSTALFAGDDASGNENLWVTDGTSAGTSELTVAGAYSGGLFYYNGLSPEFTVLGSKALFAGDDASGNENLWVTDGTSAGTSELTVAGAYGSGLLIDPSEFTVLGSKALFQGEDASGKVGLWVTDGTSAGTTEVTAVTAAEPFGGLSDFTVLATSPTSPPPSGDFNADGYSDFLWQNTGGQAAIWLINGTSVIGGGLAGSNPGPNWQAIGTGDFNADGKSDILWQNTNGQAVLWEMNGTSVIGGGLAGPNPGPSWQVKGSGDFNNDGKSDILWQNTNGQAVVWEMNGTSLIGGGLAGPNPGSSWRVVGSGDFNGDGYSDILWQNTNGQAVVWEMNGTNVIGGGLAGPNPGPSWQVIGAGDFNNDGKSDILWQNTNGQAVIWEMDGANLIGGGLVGPNPGPNWQAAGAGDFNGDGYSDILWQNTSGQAVVWELNGTNVIGGGPVGGNPGPSWHFFAG